MEKVVQSIPANINAVLENKGFDKSELASRIGVSAEDFYQMLKNKKLMTPDVFLKICVVLGTTPESLVRRCLEE